MKKLYSVFSISCLSLLVSYNGSAQYFNPPNKAFTTGNGPYSVVSADFNGDGKKDLATANSAANNVSILLGSGTGTFGTANNFAVGTSPYGLTTADFNTDGKADLAICNAGSNNITVLLGNGAGSFGAPANIACGTGPRCITSADINGDGKTDLATGNYGGANVSVLLGNGLGGFGVATNFAAANGPRGITSADFNGDTKLDLAISNETSNNVSILIGNGLGSFGAPTNFAVGPLPRSVTSADFNADGKKDLATANGGSNNVSVLLGTGTGSFSAATNFATYAIPYSVTSVDFDTDGKMDLAAACWGSSIVSVLMGTGTGSFSLAKNFGSTIWTVPANPAAMASADFNGDLKPDLAIANNAYNSISMLNSYIPVVGTCPNPKRIVMLGASGTFGFGATVFDSAYAYRYRQFIVDSVSGFWEVYNISHAGYTTYAMQATGYPTPGGFPVDTLRNITKALQLKPDAVILNFVTNDADNLFDLDTTKNNFLRVTNKLTSMGIPFWITTTAPRNYTVDPAPVILQKKTLGIKMRDTIIKYYPTQYVESYVGFAAGNGDILPQYDSGDNTHFSNAGYRLLFNNFKAKKIPQAICSPLGISTNNNAENKLKIYPNPSNGVFIIESPEEISQIEVLDVIGNVIYRSEVKTLKSQIDLSNKAKGVYFVRITENKITSSHKIVMAN